MVAEPEIKRTIDSPYIGLMPFSEKEADYFCGREKDIEVVANNLRAARLTVLYGGSGVGKSSLLNAGVLPYLRKMAIVSPLPDEPPEFILVVLRDWANNPIEGLNLKIKEAVSGAVNHNYLPGVTASDVDKKASELKEVYVMSELLKSWTDMIGTDLLVILDQFEDIFLRLEFLTGTGSFGEEFPKAVNNMNLRVNFMISLRDDAFTKLDFFKGKMHGITRNTLRLNPLNRESTEEAIREPLKIFKNKEGVEYSIQTELAERLLQDLQVDKVKLDTQGQANIGQTTMDLSESLKEKNGYQVETPYLQLVMLRLWNHETTKAEKYLKEETLDDLGGVQKIVETHLDEAMNRLTDAERNLVSEFIHFTVTRYGTKIPLDAKTLCEFAEMPQSGRGDIERVLQKLSSGEFRIYKSVPNRRHPNHNFYEVTHDALGPAILSWRKRAVEEKKIKEEKEEREKQLAEEKRKSEEQAAELARERMRREKESKDQQRILEQERKGRRFGRIIVGMAAVILALLVTVISIYYKIKKNEEFSNYKTQIEAERDKRIADEQAKKDELVNLKLKQLEALANQNGVYKSLFEILVDLRSNNPGTVKVALNRLKEKADLGELPEEYKNLFSEILSDTKTPVQDKIQKEDAINAITMSKAKIVSSDASAPVIIYLHIQSADQRSRAKQIETLLEGESYIVPGIENVGEKLSITRNELRYFRKDDEADANKICSFLTSRGIATYPKSMRGYENSPLVRSKQFELWLSVSSSKA